MGKRRKRQYDIEVIEMEPSSRTDQRCHVGHAGEQGSEHGPDGFRSFQRSRLLEDGATSMSSDERPNEESDTL